METWGFACVGAGLIADYHARALADTKNADLVGFFDLDRSRAENIAAKYNAKTYHTLDELLCDPQVSIVTIATPSGAHLEPAIAAAEYGKHVICEKPLEVTPERVDRMIQAHRKAGTTLGCIFQTRYAESLDPLRHAVSTRRFGTLTYAGVYVPWWRSDEYYRNTWHGTWELDGGGALMNQSIHMIDTLCELLPNIESIHARTAHIGHPFIETEDTAAAVLTFTGGALGLVYGSTASWPGQSKRIEITGTGGTAVYVEDSYTVFDFADKHPSDKEVLERFGSIQYRSGNSAPNTFPHELHTVCFNDFIEAVESGKPFKIDGDEARKSVALIHAIYESARTGKTVNLTT